MVVMVSWMTLRSFYLNWVEHLEGEDHRKHSCLKRIVFSDIERKLYRREDGESLGRWSEFGDVV